MSKSLIAYAGLMLFGILISSIAQMLLKKESLKQQDIFISQYLNWRAITAYAIFFGATLLSVIAYKVEPLSYGPALGATNNFYVTAFGVFIFKEEFSKKKVLALLLILVGIVIYLIGL